MRSRRLNYNEVWIKNLSNMEVVMKDKKPELKRGEFEKLLTKASQPLPYPLLLLVIFLSLVLDVYSQKVK
jgi:hypothetical protein